MHYVEGTYSCPDNCDDDGDDHHDDHNIDDDDRNCHYEFGDNEHQQVFLETISKMLIESSRSHHVRKNPKCMFTFFCPMF